MKLFILFLLISTQVQASFQQAPANFEQNGKKIVFIDIQSIETVLIYNLDKKQTIAKSIIRFDQHEKGYPVFDLKPEVHFASLNSKSVFIKTISDPTNVTTYKLIDSKLAPGSHQLTIENYIDVNTKLSSDSVLASFWMSDLTDRKYVEQYLPTNLEHDQYEQFLEVKFKSSRAIKNHEVFTNGFLNKISENHFKISFPDYFSASSFYLHISSEDRFKKNQFRYESINGKSFPVLIYSKFGFGLNAAKASTIKVLDELEQKLGAYGHPSLTIYLSGSGGMEYAGATMTSMAALGHEITHSYFARGVMAANGNAGWIDEAIASWRDKGYQAVTLPNFSSSNMGAHSQYQRSTDRKAYEAGANFMAYLNFKLKNQGGLIAFLKDFYQQKNHTSITTFSFKKELELYTGIDFANDFNQYILSKMLSREIGKQKVNIYHPQLSQKQLLDLL